MQCHHFPVQVYYEDTDFSGYVYHANYLAYCERGRSDILRLIGVRHRDLADASPENKAAFVVSRMDCKFLKPARIDDVLEVQTRLVSAKGARMFISQKVCRDEDALFQAEVTAALIDPNGRPKRFSPQMMQAFFPDQAKPAQDSKQR